MGLGEEAAGADRLSSGTGYGDHRVRAGAKGAEAGPARSRVATDAVACARAVRRALGVARGRGDHAGEIDAGADAVSDRARAEEAGGRAARIATAMRARGKNEGARRLTCLRSWATSVTSSRTPGRSGDCARAWTAASTAWSACIATSSSPAGSVALPRLLPLRDLPATAPLFFARRGGRAGE